MQLGHRPGRPCPNRRQKTITVLHTNGIHVLDVYVCHCQAGLEAYRQLLRHAWFPATPLEPETCATFDVMARFQTENLQGKITATDFYEALVMSTDGWHRHQPPVSGLSSSDVSPLTFRRIGNNPS